MTSGGTNYPNFSKEEDVAFVISAEEKLLPPSSRWKKSLHAGDGR
jgi:hypothetical protein